MSEKGNIRSEAEVRQMKGRKQEPEG